MERRLTINDSCFDVKVTGIDTSQSGGVEVIRRDRIPDGEAITVSIDIQKFALGHPYGQFIKKFIRLETDSPDQPQFVIPIMGWLEVNETPRDFSRFMFSGNQRWQGGWYTPNIAGAVLAPSILLLIGCLAWVWTNPLGLGNWLKTGCFLLLSAQTLFLFILLTATYSRGSWVAFFVGGCCMICLPGRLRATALGSVLIFCITILLLPDGLNRVGTYAACSAFRILSFSLARRRPRRGPGVLIACSFELDPVSSPFKAASTLPSFASSISFILTS